MKQVSEEDQYAIQDIATHYGMKALLRTIQSLVEAQQRDVIRYNLHDGDEKGLSILKSRAEGAEKLYQDFTTKLKTIKNKDQ